MRRILFSPLFSSLWPGVLFKHVILLMGADLLLGTINTCIQYECLEDSGSRLDLEGMYEFRRGLEERNLPRGAVSVSGP